MKLAKFDANKEESAIISSIANRAVNMGLVKRANFLNIEMDITACHCNGTPLRLQELLEADDSNFGHDICGISSNVNRTTGEIEGHFHPRYAKPDSDTK